MPTATPPMTAPGKLLKPPRIAPASALSSTKNIIWVSMKVIGAANRPAMAPMPPAMAQDRLDTRPTEIPISLAALQFMLAARMAMPSLECSRKT